jgi:hypothetical protein
MYEKYVYIYIYTEVPRKGGTECGALKLALAIDAPIRIGGLRIVAYICMFV